jgi:hypothetical protein
MRSEHALAIASIVVMVAVLVITKSDIPGMIDYIRHGEAYVGNSLFKNRIMVDDEQLLQQIVSSPDFRDFCRRRPDFEAALSQQLRSKTTPRGEGRYRAFLSQFAAFKRDRAAVGDWESIRRITHLVHQVTAVRLTDWTRL